MQRMIRSIFVLFLLGFFAVASAQLPPKVIADKYLTQAEQLLEKQDYEAALNLIEKIIALQKEHNLTLSGNLYFKDAVAQLLEKKDYITALNIMDRFSTLQKEHSLALPDEFHFQHAQATFFKYEQIPVPADSIRVALELVSKYLSAETEGESYREALALLLKIEEKLGELEFSPDRTCAGKPMESSCWMALTSQPECYVWKSYFMVNATTETLTWTGACSDGLAEGEGTLTWNYPFSSGTTIIFEETGHLQNGRKHGQWVERVQQTEEGNNQPDPSGWRVSEGPYVLGTKHGQWVERDWRGDRMRKGAYVNGKEHGQWVIEEPRYVFKATYVNGLLHGPQFTRFSDGSTEEGSAVNGNQHGRWVWRYPNGKEAEGTYVNGVKHGRWVWRYPNGTIRHESTYVNGEEQ